MHYYKVHENNNYNPSHYGPNGILRNKSFLILLKRIPTYLMLFEYQKYIFM